MLHFGGGEKGVLLSVDGEASATHVGSQDEAGNAPISFRQMRPT